jgi:hypothetical protein
MTSRTHTLLTGLGRFVRCLTLVLLPALVAEGGQAASAGRDPVGAPSESSPESPYPYSPPYLAVVGPPPMRFREPPAPPSFELEPLAAGPAQLEEIMPASPTATGARLNSSQPMAGPPQSSSPKSPSSSAAAKRPEDSEPSSILPDDMRREVRPEDLLPYFQYPRNGGVIGVPVPPQPAQPTLPPSSATYRQQ